jgi:hypothetical protein
LHIHDALGALSPSCQPGILALQLGDLLVARVGSGSLWPTLLFRSAWGKLTMVSRGPPVGQV